MFDVFQPLNPLAPTQRRLADARSEQRALDWAGVCAMPQMVGYWDPAQGVLTTSGDTPPLTVGSPVGYYPDQSGQAKHASQATTANKPILRQTPTTKQYWLDADSTDALNITLASQLTNAAIFRVTAEGVTVSRGQTVATTYNLVTSYAYNGPIAIFDESSTALTAEQVAQITRFMQASVPSISPTNLVTNGNFSTADLLWLPHANSTLSIEGNRLKVSAIAAGQYGARYPAIGKSHTPLLGKALYVDGAAPVHRWVYFGGIDVVSAFPSGSLGVSEVVAAADESLYFITTAANAGDYFYLDDVSIQEFV